MNEALLHPEVQKFIRNYTEEIASLAFKGSPFDGISVRELILQIEGFRKTEKKLPTWHSTEGIYFPPKLILEQTSSETSAKYKASLVSGKSLADITGGFGVDCFYFRERFESVDHFERNEILSEIAAHNFKILGAGNVHCRAADGLAVIKDKKYEVIYADPARRHDSKGKVFFLKDCEPNVVETSDFLLERCHTLLIKTSPMLDISMGLNELKGVCEIHVVAIDNEVKELVWILRKNTSETTNIKTLNFSKTRKEKFDFAYGQDALPSYAMPHRYLYEPNASIMKAGAFQYIPEAFGVHKLHPNSHLYTSEKLIAFPGRSFRIAQVIPYGNKAMKRHFFRSKANITTRNFNQTVKDLRKKWKIKEGGESYLFFTTNVNNDKVVLICERINVQVP